jgi:hypothetical protein
MLSDNFSQTARDIAYRITFVIPLAKTPPPTSGHADPCVLTFIHLAGWRFLFNPHACDNYEYIHAIILF